MTPRAGRISVRCDEQHREPERDHEPDPGSARHDEQRAEARQAEGGECKRLDRRRRSRQRRQDWSEAGRLSAIQAATRLRLTSAVAYGFLTLRAKFATTPIGSIPSRSNSTRRRRRSDPVSLPDPGDEDNGVDLLGERNRVGDEPRRRTVDDGELVARPPDRSGHASRRTRAGVVGSVRGPASSTESVRVRSPGAVPVRPPPS